MGGIAFHLARGGKQDVVMLPPEQSSGKVKLIGTYTGDVPGIIADCWLDNDEWARYLDCADIIGETIQPHDQTLLEKIVVRNPQNPAADLRGVLTLHIRWGDAGEVFKCPVPFTLQRFPDFPGIFALDYGNSSSTCVVLPDGTQDPFRDKSFRALNLDKSGGEESSHPSAIEFKDIVDGAVKSWDVGDGVLRKFKELIASSKLADQQKSFGFQTGRLKRYLGRRDSEPIQSYSSLTGMPGPKLTGDQINGMILEKFVRGAEEYAWSSERPTGRFLRVVATHPVNFNPLQLDALQSILSERLRLPRKDVILRYDEATAAAIYYLTEMFLGPGRIHEFWARTDQPTLPIPASADGPPLPGQGKGLIHTFNMLVFDCGGGTTDIALMRVEVVREERTNKAGLYTRNWFEIRPMVIGLTGLKDFAGDNMTLEVFKLLRARLAEQIARLGQPLELVEERWSNDDRNNFNTELVGLRAEVLKRDSDRTDQEFYREIEEYCKAIVPTNFARYAENTNSLEYRLRRNCFYQLWELAEEAKIQLCTLESCEVSTDRLALLEQYRLSDGRTLKEEPLFQNMVITRAELDERLQQEVGLAWELAADLCQDLQGEKIHQVILAGNGSRYPLIERMLREVFADGKFFEYQQHRVLLARKDAKLAVAKGAALAEWFRNYTPIDFDRPDKEVVKFNPQSNLRLPYSLFYQGAGGNDEPLFERGLELHADPNQPKEKRAHLSGAHRDTDPDAAQHKHVGNSYREREPLCSYETEDVPDPEGVPKQAERKVVFTINCELEIRAFLQWRIDERTPGVKVELIKKPVLERDESKDREPFSGRH